MAVSKIPYIGKVILNLSEIGVTTPCTMQTIINAMPFGSRAVINVTTEIVTDVPKNGTLYIDRSHDNNTPQKSRIILITPQQNDTSLTGDEWMIGFVPFASGSTAKWYAPTITQYTP